MAKRPQSDSYDLIVIGSGPGGHRAAVQAAKLGKKVLIVEKDEMGGASLHLGTIPSKTLRERALAAKYDQSSIADIMERTHKVIDEERSNTEEHFRRNSIEAVCGLGSFVDKHTVKIENAEGTHLAKAKIILIATGTRPRRPVDLVFDGETLFDSDSILKLNHQPKTLLILGAGVIGCEYASIFARMGVAVTLLDGRADLLASIDREIIGALTRQFEKFGIDLLMSTQFSNIAVKKSPEGRTIATIDITSEGGYTESKDFDAILYCLGRTGNHEKLNLAAIGVAADNRGSIPVNSDYQTATPNVYAVGDIIGAPALAASSAEQGRLAMLHAFENEKAEFPDTFPYGIYTIPEISSVGVQEAELQAKGIQYVVGKAPYPILARGKMLEDEFGFLKLLVHKRTRQIMGVHVIGTSATELVHIGQVAMAFGAKVDFFIDNVFNYPTLAEAYKVAALNAESKLNRS
ncbi:MAG: Si-specific NAD(P)(+) transhydrogenase [Proteobacteria bacterium]|nr:MAG: Si-specific NAD(P)(+) transhydrogenase [Pseudomonadota bacterium]